MGKRGRRYTAEPINAILKEVEAPGAKVREVLRRHGVASKTSYCWEQKYGGLEISKQWKLPCGGS